MLRRIRAIIFVLVAAVAGAIAGKVVAEVRRRQEAGEDPGSIDPSAIQLRPADLVPGLVAAVRVRDQPWSWLHIPSWLAAFAVNLAVGAIGGNLQRLREMAEQTVYEMTGVDLSGQEPDAPPMTYEAYTYDVSGTPPSDAGPAWPAPGGAETAPEPGSTPDSNLDSSTSRE